MRVRGVSYIRSNLGTPGENAALSPRGVDGWGQRAYHIAETGLLGCIGPVSVSRYTARLCAIGADLGTGH